MASATLTAPFRKSLDFECGFGKATHWKRPFHVPKGRHGGSLAMETTSGAVFTGQPQRLELFRRVFSGAV